MESTDRVESSRPDGRVPHDEVMSSESESDQIFGNVINFSKRRREDVAESSYRPAASISQFSRQPNISSLPFIDEFLKKEHTNYSRALRDLLKAEHALVGLERHEKEKTIPRSLKINVKSQFPKTTAEQYTAMFQSVVIKAQTDLLSTVIASKRSEIQSLQRQVNDVMINARIFIENAVNKIPPHIMPVGTKTALIQQSMDKFQLQLSDTYLRVVSQHEAEKAKQEAKRTRAAQAKEAAESLPVRETITDIVRSEVAKALGEQKQKKAGHKNKSSEDGQKDKGKQQGQKKPNKKKGKPKAKHPNSKGNRSKKGPKSNQRSKSVPRNRESGRGNRRQSL